MQTTFEWQPSISFFYFRLRGSKWSFKNHGFCNYIFTKISGSHSLVFCGYFNLTGSIFFTKPSLSQFFARLRKSLSTDVFVCVLQKWCLNSLKLTFKTLWSFDLTMGMHAAWNKSQKPLIVCTAGLFAWNLTSLTLCHYVIGLLNRVQTNHKHKRKRMWFGCEQPFLWRECCTTFQKTATNKTICLLVFNFLNNALPIYSIVQK